MNRIKEAIELLVVLAVVIGCHVSSKMSTPQNTAQVAQDTFPAFDKEGHRGCRGLMPENTIPAMLKALELGVTTLEMDAQVTKDQQIITSQDPNFNRDITTAKDGSPLDSTQERNLVLYNMTYQQTLQYDVGLKPYPKFSQQQRIAAHKPLLSDLIDSTELYCKTHKRSLPFYNIETKSMPATDNIYHPEPDKFVALLMKVINSKGILQRVIIQSFDVRTLQIINDQYPSVRTSLLVEPPKADLFKQLNELGFIPTIYSPQYLLVNDKLLRECHQYHIKVIPWTVNDKPTIEKLKTMGVDGIITDYPNLF